MICKCRFLLVASVLLVGACSTSAPPLPVDTTSVNRSYQLSSADFSQNDLIKSCENIRYEQVYISRRIQADRDVIQGNRQQNETAGYLGAMFIVPLIATNSNSDEKADIEQLQKRSDVLLELSSYKRCPTVY